VKAYVPALAFLGLCAAGLLGARETLESRTADAEPAAIKSENRAPEMPADSGPRTASLRKEGDGHYWANASVNGATMRFLVDTGATVVALTERDARRAGLDVEKLPRTARISTANGEVRAAVARLDRIRIANVEVRNVEAVVLEELETSLLGMSFLGKLKSWQMTPASMVLKQ
jgi:aspartyl protease family protein